jgi:hypothetical protein
MAATLTKILREEPRPASSIAKVPRTLDAVIARALRKDRNARYDSAAHLATDLECVLEGKPPVHATQLGPLDTIALNAVHAPRRPAPSFPGGAPGALDPYAAEQPPKKGNLPLVGAVALGVALGIGVVLFLQREPAPPNPDPGTAASGSAQGPETRPVPPTPIPTRIPAPEPTVPVLSISGSGRSARVTLDLKHPFASGSLRIKVDDRVVLANNISGMPTKVLGVIKGYDGRFGTDLVIPPGEHVIKVEVRSGASEFIESRNVKLSPGESRRLVALVGKTLTLILE